MTKSEQPIRSAVALSYSDDAPAPKVVAKGRGMVAEEIIKRANEHGVYVHQSKELVTLLMKLDLDDAIPPALYRVVAELLAWLYHIESGLSASSVPPLPPLK
ncbi:EscU/YscU/HrcU family type III secretion system export apparatus switch protein [Undibacterium fentianense]|uniref:EscU/YscU/HrcU family type III secretion system export apparatus switch protein n=1 Tax=Undibacterium fentianense TaxID=2828728 RepID=A0A941E0C7_9BURK|nr:EscU/YscU/HrcU family type III secretion system export apparatus switch protein [Undibacterium fentianense]MBR7798937.1 EscU/YscU/HrcU family type III secretion system export apparatus switch protein [Undibacterium fentianense]